MMLFQAKQWYIAYVYPQNYEPWILLLLDVIGIINQPGYEAYKTHEPSGWPTV